MLKCLVGVSKTTHATHDAEHIVVDRVYTDLSGVGRFNSGVRENKLKGGVVDAREIAGARWLMFFGAESERVEIDASVGVAAVVLPRLDKVEVGAFAFREAVLAIELELGGNNRVFSPAVHVERGFGEDEGASIRDGGLGTTAHTFPGGSSSSITG